MLVGPHVLAAVGGLGHRGIPDGTGEVGAVRRHLVEVGLVGADALGDDAQEPLLEVGEAGVEVEQQLGAAGQILLGQARRLVAVGEPSRQRVRGRQRSAEVAVAGVNYKSLSAS